MESVQEKKMLSIWPVGVVENALSMKDFSPCPSDDPVAKRKAFFLNREKVKESESRIRIFSEYRKLILGLSEFSHIDVLFWPHELGEDTRKIEQVHPRGWQDLPLQGVFATRSPARPNPILVSRVRLLSVVDNTLHVKGLDAIDKSPVIDVKPVVKMNDDLEPFRVAEWVNTK